MSRAPELVLQELMQVTAHGWAFPAGGTLYEALFSAMGRGLADLEATAEQMLDETDPRSANLCLPDFERVLGADPCGRDLNNLSVSQRRQIASQRWTSRGGASIPYFIDMAGARGTDIKIIENIVSQIGQVQAGDDLVGEGEQFVWIVRVALSGEVLFRADDSAADDRLYDLTLSDIECDIRRLKPAHTEVVFHYI